MVFDLPHLLWRKCFVQVGFEIGLCEFVAQERVPRALRQTIRKLVVKLGKNVAWKTRFFDGAAQFCQKIKFVIRDLLLRNI